MMNVFKSKKIASFFSLVLVITMLMLPTVVFANDTTRTQTPIQPRWSYLHICSNGLYNASNIQRGVYASADTHVYEGHAGVQVQLQKWDSDMNRWLNYSGAYWEAYSTTGFAYIDEDDFAVPAGAYRLSIVHTAYSDDYEFLESFATYSNEIRVTP